MSGFRPRAERTGFVNDSADSSDVEALCNPSALQFGFRASSANYLDFCGCEQIFDDALEMVAHHLARLRRVARAQGIDDKAVFLDARMDAFAPRLGKHVSAEGRPVAEAIRAISVTAFTYYRWRKEFGGLKSDQVKRLRDLEKENERLRKAVSDLTLEKLILKEAASGNF